MEVKLPTEGTRYVQALLLTATAYLQYRAHFLPAVAAYRGYGRPAVPKVPVQALRACLAIGHGTLPLPSVAWVRARSRLAGGLGWAAMVTNVGVRRRIAPTSRGWPLLP